MVDVLAKVQVVDGAWTAGTVPHLNQMNLHLCSGGNDLTGHGRNSRSTRPHYVDNPSARRWGHRNTQRRSHNSQTWSYDMSSHPSQFVPAPRTSKYAQRTHAQSTRSYLNQIKLVESLAEFKRHPMVHADPLQRPFHGQACKCLPLSGLSVTVFMTKTKHTK